MLNYFDSGHFLYFPIHYTMTLVVQCKKCKAIHDSPLQSVSTAKEFVVARQKSELFENLWKCPKCGRMSEYTRFDYYWQEKPSN